MSRNMWLFSLFSVALLLSGCSSTGETESETTLGFDLVFKQDRVLEVAISVDAGFDAMIAQYLNDGQIPYYAATFQFEGEEPMDQVGFRLKADVRDGPGKSEPKYSLKINFNEFGQERFYRIDQLHFGDNKPDPSLMRETLSTRAYRAMGVPTNRTAYAWVTVDDEEPTLYTMRQDIDKRFIKDWYGTALGVDDGNLYKCSPPGCNLTWKGSSRSDYVDTSCGEPSGCGLILQTNEEDPQLNDYSDLINFLNIVNNVSPEDFPEAIEAVFDVDTFLKYLAVAVVISDYDGYIGSVDNFFLYHRPDTGRFVYIPWDMNKSYGKKKCDFAVDETGVNPSVPWCDDEARPLLYRILSVPEFVDRYEGYLAQVLDDVFTVDKQQQWVDEADSLISDFVEADTNSYVTFAAYKLAVSGEDTGTNPMPIIRFVETRRAFLLDHL